MVMDDMFDEFDTNERSSIMSKSNGKQGTATAEPKKNHPVHEVRYGAIKAVCWRNATKNGPMHSVRLGRLYLVDGQWQESSSLGRDDLLTAAKVLSEMHTWIHQQEQSTRDQQSSEEQGEG
jgi:hypothetical protein